MPDLIDLTALQLRDAIAAGEATSEQATRACLGRIDALNGTLGALVHVFAEKAIEQAKAVDAKLAAGRPLGPLGGVPMAIKDNMTTSWGVTSCGSKMLADFHAPYDATAVARILSADGVVLGKGNMDEFAMGSSTEHSALMRTVNPWDPACVPGGSSGGSAAAVSARLAPAALGSDTGGSIRQPAAFCGLVGMKPTYGRVSRYGLVAFASSLDQIGPFARTVADAAWLLGAVAGRDPHDSTSVDLPVPDYLADLDTPLDGLRVGVVDEYFGQGLDGQVKAAAEASIAALRDAGAQTVEVSLPHATKYSIAAYYIVATAEASSNLARYDGVHYGHRSSEVSDYTDIYLNSRAEGFGAEVKRRIMLGTYALSSGYYDAYYLRALKVRRLIRDDFNAAFEKCDVLIGPTTPATAFAIGDKLDDPLQMYLTDIYTSAINLAGLPGVSVPVGLDDAGRPIGCQLIAGAFEEPKLLRAARMLEQAMQWNDRKPPV